MNRQTNVAAWRQKDRHAQTKQVVDAVSLGVRVTFRSPAPPATPAPDSIRADTPGGSQINCTALSYYFLSIFTCFSSLLPVDIILPKFIPSHSVLQVTIEVCISLLKVCIYILLLYLLSFCGRGGSFKTPKKDEKSLLYTLLIYFLQQRNIQLLHK